MISVFYSCDKTGKDEKAPAAYELVFTDVDGTVCRSSELLSDLEREDLYEGVYYEGGKCFIESAEDETLVCYVYELVLGEFNDEYGSELGTYAFAPLLSFVSGVPPRTKAGNGNSTLSESFVDKAEGIFRGILDKWKKGDSEGDIFRDLQAAWDLFKEKPVDASHYKDSFQTFLLTVQLHQVAVEALKRKSDPADRQRQDQLSQMSNMLKDDASRLGELDKFFKQTSDIDSQIGLGPWNARIEGNTAVVDGHNLAVQANVPFHLEYVLMCEIEAGAAGSPFCNGLVIVFHDRVHFNDEVTGHSHFEMDTTGDCTIEAVEGSGRIFISKILSDVTVDISYSE